MRAATVEAEALRLRPAQHPLGAAHGRRVQAGQPGQGGDLPGDAHAPRHEPEQVRRAGRAALPLAAYRPLPGDRDARARELPGRAARARRLDRRAKADRPPVVEPQGHPAVRDDARAPRHHALRADGWRQVDHLQAPGRRAGQDARHPAPQRALQPQGDPRAGDVRRGRPGLAGVGARRVRDDVGQVQQPQQPSYSPFGFGGLANLFMNMRRF